MCHNMSKYNIFRILVSCLALLIVFRRFYYSICLGGLGGLQCPMWSLLRASMVLLKVREHLYLKNWWFSKGFVTLTFKNFSAKSFFIPINRTNGCPGGLQHPIWCLLIVPESYTKSEVASFLHSGHFLKIL